MTTQDCIPLHYYNAVLKDICTNCRCGHVRGSLDTYFTISTSMYLRLLATLRNKQTWYNQKILQTRVVTYGSVIRKSTKQCKKIGKNSHPPTPIFSFIRTYQCTDEQTYGQIDRRNSDLDYRKVL